MMRLMSDLIAYLRDLLVFKAKPDALKEDVDPDVQKSLGVHAELIAMDRLLELIDQFAAAEGRMKWAPNKKLHFEVAIIKAIQSLGQATLDAVMEKSLHKKNLPLWRQAYRLHLITLQPARLPLQRRAWRRQLQPSILKSFGSRCLPEFQRKAFCER